MYTFFSIHPPLLVLLPKARQAVDADDFFFNTMLRSVLVDRLFAVVEGPIVIDDAET